MTVDLPAPDGPNSTVTPGEGTSNAISICTEGKLVAQPDRQAHRPSAAFSRLPTHSDSSSPTSASVSDTSDSSAAFASPPGILSRGIVGYATCLGEFGAVITFAANIPGQTQTLPLAIYAALQVPGGEAKAAELSLVSLTLALIGLLLSEWIGKRLNAALGR